MSHWELRLEDLAMAMSGTILQRKMENFTAGVSTDTREVLAGKIFIALRGDHFDAHNFLQDAIRGGAGCLVVDREVDLGGLGKSISIVRVPDTLRGLQDLARFWRRRLTAQVVGITGSSGKTTTKAFAAQIISPHRKCQYAKGSFNNHWGVPLTILATPLDCEVLILEMGMNHLREIETLVNIGEPDVTVCTMVGTAHIGELGSQENIARAKSEIYFTREISTMVFNVDNEWTLAMYERARVQLKSARLIRFSGFRTDVDVRLRAESINGFELQVSGRVGAVEGEALVPIFGRHNVVNLMAAAGIALAVGLTPEQIWGGLGDCQSEWGRNHILKSALGATILFDAYNANPESMAAVVRNLFEVDCSGKRVAVLGEMLELGDRSAEFHRELGGLVARSGIDVVWFLGPHADDFEAGLRAENFSKKFLKSDSYKESVAEEIGSMLDGGDIAVIKGSRGMKLERVLTAWGISAAKK